MSDRKEALTDLLAMVDAGLAFCPEERRYAEEFCSLFDRCFDEAMFDLFSAGYEGSLDAAKAFHETVIPDEPWDIYKMSQFPGMIPDSSPLAYGVTIGWDGIHRSYAKKPARAWIASILRHLIAQED